MSIWKTPLTLDAIQLECRDTLVDHLAIAFTEIGDDYLEATMPVDKRTHQPFGILHGGASVALAETLGSYAANACINRQRFSCVGMEINANHLWPVSSGIVTGRAEPVFIGVTSQVWEIKIRNEKQKLVCISRLTVAVRRLKKTPESE
ncbi:MAG: hotdog fold thioesterase [Halopseudomonas sp.]